MFIYSMFSEINTQYIYDEIYSMFSEINTQYIYDEVYTKKVHEE